SVKEVYDQTIRAFNLSERYRMPVVLLFDQVISHLLEPIELADMASLELVDRPWATGDSAGFEPYASTETGVPPMPRPGDGYRTHTTGLTHGEDGFPTQDPEVVTRATQRLLDKVENHRADIESYECHDTEDAEVLIVAYGISARAARAAVRRARGQGIAAGLFRPITIWPFPEEALKAAASKAKAILVPEMNAGQLVLEIERIVGHDLPVAGLNRIDGQAINPDEILQRIKELAAK
ncbi:MAG: 2-oxoacid:acceptor oxidoreductase subunit alpha, partial [Rhodospirillaceae bacterium]|nr:2-oxoacid:acceptor oxidoreductase subunit alpha [Rhodospirillaceae bacterium]